DKEKLGSGLPIIGKFGVGLKDALATFHRNGVEVVIRSNHGTFTLKQVSKHGFDNIITLHVEFDDAPVPIQGTDFVLTGVSDAEMAGARALFLRFSKEEVLDTTSYGAIIRRNPQTAKVYILGVLASDEPNFLFSYNITSLTEAMKKRLNRERLNVGRTTYTDRIKTILRSANSAAVHVELVEQVGIRAFGDQRDEMQWIEISQLALNLMH
ncbi:MAG: ATP-binding protein, partial [Bacteroidota bacterium]